MSARLFLAEGPQAVREALELTDCVVEVFVTDDAATRHSDLASRAHDLGASWHLVEDVALASLTDTVSPQGLVAVCRFVDVTLEQVIEASPRLVAVCADIRDPGNAGAVIRCADAAGADGVILAGNSVDAYNSKVVRASVGSIFHLPVVRDAPVGEAISGLRAAGCQVLAADGNGQASLDDVLDAGQLAGPTAWLFGNEAWGLPEQTQALADHVVAIPIYGRAESLNLATASAICLYASARAQRNTPKDPSLKSP
ncbi:MAG: RNA methyltransferase [Nocardioidaceae bacterium]|nr:RNA methyltransferase [Nocardioidaceae bacterium]